MVTCNGSALRVRGSDGQRRCAHGVAACTAPQRSAARLGEAISVCERNSTQCRHETLPGRLRSSAAGKDQLLTPRFKTFNQGIKRIEFDLVCSVLQIRLEVKVENFCTFHCIYIFLKCSKLDYLLLMSVY